MQDFKEKQEVFTKNLMSKLEPFLPIQERIKIINSLQPIIETFYIDICKVESLIHEQVLQGSQREILLQNQIKEIALQNQIAVKKLKNQLEEKIYHLQEKCQFWELKIKKIRLQQQQTNQNDQKQSYMESQYIQRLHASENLIEEILQKLQHQQNILDVQKSEISVLNEEKKQLEQELTETKEKYKECSRLQGELEDNQINSLRVEVEKDDLISRVKSLKKLNREEKSKYRHRYDKLMGKAQEKIHRLKDFVTEYQVHLSSLMQEIDRLKKIIIKQQEQDQMGLLKQDQLKVARDQFDQEIRSIEMEVNGRLKEILQENNLPIQSIQFEQSIQKKYSLKGENVTFKFQTLMETVRLVQCENSLLKHLVKENFKSISQELMKFTNQITPTKDQQAISISPLKIQLNLLMVNFQRRMMDLQHQIHQQFQTSPSKTSDNIKTEHKFSSVDNVLEKQKTEKALRYQQEKQRQIRKNLILEFERTTKGKLINI